jgi:hypothetical protein
MCANEDHQFADAKSFVGEESSEGVNRGISVREETIRSDVGRWFAANEEANLGTSGTGEL